MTQMMGCSCFSELLSLKLYRLIYEELPISYWNFPGQIHFSASVWLFMVETFFSERNAAHIFLGCAGDHFPPKW